MKKVFVYLLTVIMLCMSVTVYAGDVPEADSSSGISLEIGDYIQLGKMYDKPILWRCIDIDENGMLMLSDKSLCIRQYDALPADYTGSHKRRRSKCMYDGYDNHYCQASNYWADSSIRSWLNSAAPAGEVKWLCGNPCDDEKGFLADGNFTQNERNAIKTVTQKSLLDPRDAILAVGGNSSAWYSTISWNPKGSEKSQLFPEENYNAICYEYATDKVFLLDLKQFYSIYKNENILGKDYYQGRLTQEAMDNLGGIEELRYTPLENMSYYYYLRTPYGTEYVRTKDRTNPSGDAVLEVSTSAYISNHVGENFVTNYSGIRPAFYLNEETAQILSGSGTEDDPYIVDGKETGINVYVNGWELNSDVPPMIENDRTLVPLRAIFEELDAEVSWNDAEQSVTAVRGDTTVYLKINDKKMTVNGTEVELDAPAKIVSDRTLVPLRAVSEAFGAKVDWIGETQTVMISLL